MNLNLNSNWVQLVKIGLTDMNLKLGLNLNLGFNL
jgi:hypothetical protein